MDKTSIACIANQLHHGEKMAREFEMYDVDERVLLGLSRLTGVSVDKLYGALIVRLLMRLSARALGTSVKRPR